jgi:hypothetical protein
MNSASPRLPDVNFGKGDVTVTYFTGAMDGSTFQRTTEVIFATKGDRESWGFQMRRCQPLKLATRDWSFGTNSGN